MNYTQTFEEFSRGLNGTDLALYAGIGIVLWILFQDKLNPVKELLVKTLNSFKSRTSTDLAVPNVSTNTTVNEKEDVFFQLIASWKLTRDLAVKNGCVEAVKVADQMFPCLSPTVCNEKE